MKYISIDRFEGKYAVCIYDDEKIEKIEKKNLPKNVKEGDVLKVLPNGNFEFDLKETNRRRDEIFKLQEDLFEE